jgi:hypothetical protein
MRMPEERWPAVIHSCIRLGRSKRGRPRRSWRGDITEEKKKDGGRRRPGPETLEERIGNAADSRISPYTHSARIPLVCVINYSVLMVSQKSSV